MVDTDDTRRTTDDGKRTTPRVWHKLPTGELKNTNTINNNDHYYYYCSSSMVVVVVIQKPTNKSFSRHKLIL